MEYDSNLLIKSVEAFINLKKFIHDQKGNAVVMVLLGTIGVVSVSYMVFKRASINRKSEIITKADKEVDDAAMKIGSYFLSPANCNANFFLVNFPGSLNPGANIKTCPSGHCAAVGAGTNTIPIIDPTNTTSWTPALTGLTNRIRIVKVDFILLHAQTHDNSTPNTRRAGVLEITVHFQKNLGIKSDGTRHTSTVRRKFEAFVVSADWPGGPPWTPIQRTNIAGCAWSPNSTTVYKN